MSRHESRQNKNSLNSRISKNELSVKKGGLNKVLDHDDIKFTQKMEEERSIPFLDVQVERKENGTFTTSIYRKKTSSDVYIHWNFFAPHTWKV